MWNLKYGTNELIYKTETGDSLSVQWLGLYPSNAGARVQSWVGQHQPFSVAKNKTKQIEKKNRLTDIENRKETYGYQRGEGEFGISRYKLLYIKQINNKVLLYSTGNYSQYLVITYNGREY